MAIVALLGVNEQGGVQHFNIPDSLLGAINGAAATIGQDGLQISDGTILKALGNNINGSGIVENEDGSITFKSYTELGRYSGQPIASLAINSNGKLITVPYSKNKTQTLTTQTLQESNISGNEGYITMFNETEDGVIESNIYQNNAGLIGINNPNPFNLLDINAGSMNVTQAVDGHGYKLNNNLVLNYDTTNDYLLIGSTVDADVALRRNSTNIGFVTDGGLDLQDNLLTTGAVQFDLATSQTTDIGKTLWDADFETLSVGINSNYTYRFGNSGWWLCKCDEAISKGSPVYASGAVGVSRKISISNFIANGSIEERLIVGSAAESGNIGDWIVVVMRGEIEGIDTSAYSNGTVLYPSSSSAGAWTSTEPTAPNQKIPMAFVVNSHAVNGAIVVRSYAQGYHLGELHDIHATSPSDLDLLYWNDNNSRYELADFETLGIATDETAWMLGATNVLTAASDIGSASGNYDINLKRAGTTIATLKSTGLAVPSLTSGYLPKAGTGGLLGNSLIYDNGTETGIGGVLGSVKFNINSTLAILGNFNFPSTGGYMRFQNNGSSFADMGSGNQIFLGGTLGDFGISSRSGSLVLGSGSISVITINPSQNVLIGTTSGSKKLTVNGDIQGTEITLTTGKALGYVAISDANGKVIWTDPSALNPWAGNWNASTNTPTLADGTGTYGEWYHVETAGSQDLGSGSITFAQGDRVIYDGSVWVKQTQNYTLNPATASVLGGIKIGSTLEIDSGTGVANQKSGVATAGTYISVTVDTYGRVTAGTNPTTIEGYGITDAYTDDEVDAFISDLEADIAANETSIGSINTKLGTVSTNYLPKWDGSKFVNSPLYVDSYGKLTYGVSTYASGRFNVAANGELASIAINGNAQYNSYNNGYNLAIGTLNDGNSWIQASYPYAGVGKNLYLQPLRGYVGIRKQSPAYALDVAQDINYDGNLFISGAAGTDGKVLGNVSGDDTWVTLNHSYISDWNTYVTNPINTLSNTITSIMSTYLFRVDNNYVPIWNPNGNWSNSYAYQANGDFFINADTCIFGVLRGSYYETPSADQFYKVKSDASGIEAVTLDSTFITEVLSLTEGSFSRNIEGLYLTKEDAAETVFIGTDLNTGAAVIRNKYYDDNDDVKAWELSLDIYNDGRLILYDPDTEASTRYVMFLDEFEDLFNEYKSQLPTGEGGGIVPSLQTVLDNTTGTTTKRISFDNSPYVTLTELNTAIAQIPTGGSVGTLDQVLSNGAIATNQEINFKDDSVSGTGLDTGLLFLDENGSEKGRISYRNNSNEMFLLSDYMFMTGTNISILASGILSFGSSIPSYADNNAAILGGLDPGNVYRTGDILKIVH